jgi:hypothetical protein
VDLLLSSSKLQAGSLGVALCKKSTSRNRN